MSNRWQTEKYAEGGSRYPTEHPAACEVKIIDAARGQVEIPSGRKKFAVVGFSSSTRDQAPYDDPAWVIAGLNQLYRYMPRVDLWFEIHHREMFLADQVRDTNYLQWLRSAPVPVFMEEQFDDIPTSVRYPIERAIGLLGREYFESSIAYMVTWGLLHGFEEIGVWGVDLIVGQEYDYQKPNLEYVLGIARGMGVKITIPSESALLKQGRVRYGARSATGPLTLKFFEAVLQQGREKREKLISELNNVDGALAAFNNMRDALLVYARGGEIKVPGENT